MKDPDTWRCYECGTKGSGGDGKHCPLGHAIEDIRKGAPVSKCDDCNGMYTKCEKCLIRPLEKIRDCLVETCYMYTTGGQAKCNPPCKICIKHPINDIALSYRGTFKDESKGNCWEGLPRDLKEYLEKIDGSFYGIHNHLLPDKEYIVEISLREIH